MFMESLKIEYAFKLDFVNVSQASFLAMQWDEVAKQWFLEAHARDRRNSGHT